MKGYDSGIRDFAGLRCRIQLRRVWQQRYVFYPTDERPDAPIRAEEWYHAGADPDLRWYDEVEDLDATAQLPEKETT